MSTARAKTASLPLVRQAPMALVLVGLVVLLAVVEPSFLRPGNLHNVLTVAAILAIPGAGMTLVIASGAFDLSVGAVVGLTGVIVVTLMPTLGVAGAVAAGLAVAAAIGAVNGLAITKLRISPFIATLAMLTILRGVTLVATNGRDQFASDRAFKVFSAGTLAGIRMPIVLALVVLAACGYILYRTPLGRHILAVGSNLPAARVAGLAVDRVRITVFAIVALTAGLWGVIVSSQLLKGSATLGSGFELDAIAVVVVGGTPLSGGQATLGGTVLGALLITVVRNGLNLLNVGAFYQQVAVGLLLILALAIQGVLRRPSQAEVAYA